MVINDEFDDRCLEPTYHIIFVYTYTYIHRKMCTYVYACMNVVSRTM